MLLLQLRIARFATFPVNDCESLLFGGIGGGIRVPMLYVVSVSMTFGDTRYNESVEQKG